MIKTLPIATIAVVLSAVSWTTKADVVITGHGIYADCDAAFEYRDGPLIDMLDGAFANYDGEVEGRIQVALQDFEKHRKAAEDAYAAADALQQKRIAFTVGKWVLLDVLGNMASKKLPDSVTEGYTPAQVKIFKDTIAASNNLKADVAKAIVTGDPPDNILSDQAVSITLQILSRYGGPVGAFMVSTGSAVVAVADDYWETQPIKDVAQQTVEIFAVAYKTMHAKSKLEKIAEVNRVKNEIDVACGN